MESTPENPAHREVAPLTPPAPWIGGKHLLAKRLARRTRKPVSELIISNAGPCAGATP